jgi:hypothetical protein
MARTGWIGKTIGGVIAGALVIGGSALGINTYVTATAAHERAVILAASTPAPAAAVVNANIAADREAVQTVTDEVTAQNMADEKAAEAAALAAQQAAQEQTAAKAATKTRAAVQHATTCPPGSTVNSGDGDVAYTCFPDVCFHVTLPDPAYPQCVTAFKP